MKKICILIVCLLIPATQAFASPALKLGAVDLQRAVKECREGNAARADLQRKAEQYNTELKTLQEEFKKISAEFDKEGAKLSTDSRAVKEAALQKKGREYQNRQRDAQEDIKQMESDYLKRLVSKLGVIIAKIGDDGKFTAILDRNNGLLYSGKEIDITQILIQKADEEFGRQR